MSNHVESPLFDVIRPLSMDSGTTETSVAVAEHYRKKGRANRQGGLFAANFHLNGPARHWQK